MPKREFGQLPDGGGSVFEYTIAGTEKFSDVTLIASILSYGAIVRTLCVTNLKKNETRDIVLGFDDLEGYLGPHNAFYGGTVGRIVGRVALGTGKCAGENVQLTKNERGIRHHHGGTKGLDRRLWSLINHTDSSVEFEYVSPHGEEGYPATVRFRSLYEIKDGSKLLCLMRGEIIDDHPGTLLSVTNHSYFNLDGHDKNTIVDDHSLKVESAFCLELEDAVPTGKGFCVVDTPYDCRDKTKLKDRLNDKENDQVKGQIGFDTYFIRRYDEGDETKSFSDLLSNFRDRSSKLENNIDWYNYSRGSETNSSLFLFSELYSSDGSLKMVVSTNQLGALVYTGNWIETGSYGKGKASYRPRGGICIECCRFPNACNLPQFPSMELLKGEKYANMTCYEFKAI